jgi:hypothetical protein
MGLPHDFVLPKPWNNAGCSEDFAEATTCQTSGGYDDYSSLKEYKFDTSGGQTSGGSMTFDDDELDADMDHGYAYRFGFIENDKRDPSTRHDHKDYQGVPWTKGVKVVTPPEVHSHVKGHWNRKHITEEYEYRDKKRKSGKKAFPDHHRTVKLNNESAKEESRQLYKEIADRLTDKKGQAVPKICRKDFFHITTCEKTDRFIADVVFNATEDQHGLCSRKYMMDSGSTFHLIC